MDNILIGAIIIALTQAVKYLAPGVKGVVTMVVAIVVGVLVAALSGPLGIEHISIAQGILDALFAIGVHTVATNDNVNTPAPKV